MNIDTAPSVEHDGDEPMECGACGAEDSFVIYDNDRVCSNCHHAPSRSRGTSVDSVDDQWQSWFEHRREEYDGFYGDDRIKFVGGFARVYP